MKIILTFLVIVLLYGNLNAQWAELNSGVTTTLYSISAVSNDYAWACGANGVVIRTTDGGTTWTNASSPVLRPTMTFYNVLANSSTKAFVAGMNAAGDSTFVFMTLTGGTNWAVVFSQAGGFVDGVWTSGGLDGFMFGNPVGGNWSLYQTNSAGGGWYSITPALPQAGAEAGYSNTFAVFGTRVWFGTNSGKIYYSTNSGSTFTAQNLGVASDTAMSMCFNGPGLGLASANSKLFTTTNAGINWAQISIPGTQTISGLAGYSLKWFAARGKDIYYSTNQGANWILQYSAPGTSTYSQIVSSRVSAGTSIAFFAIRYNGGISKLLTTTGINKVGDEIPSKFDLAQNFPNPFNPVTKIKYLVAKNSNVNITVFDVTGKEVSYLINEFHTAGTYEINFDGSKLTSGIYFYKMTVNDFSLVKKMTLIK
ncbi:MAG: T9SS type A sorting domain-containing protein [Ignavibacteriota bacterium]